MKNESTKTATTKKSNYSFKVDDDNLIIDFARPKLMNWEKVDWEAIIANPINSFTDEFIDKYIENINMDIFAENNEISDYIKNKYFDDATVTPFVKNETVENETVENETVENETVENETIVNENNDNKFDEDDDNEWGEDDDDDDNWYEGDDEDEDNEWGEDDDVDDWYESDDDESDDIEDLTEINALENEIS